MLLLSVCLLLPCLGSDWLERWSQLLPYPRFNPAQTATLRAVATGRDVLSRQPTSSGKTLAAVLPGASGDLLRDGLAAVDGRKDFRDKCKARLHPQGLDMFPPPLPSDRLTPNACRWWSMRCSLVWALGAAF